MNSLPMIVIVSMTIAAPAVLAQPPDTFEVASIKLANPLENGTGFQFQPGGSIKITGASLKSLVEYAYDLRGFQLSGATGWMASERYMIQAKGALTDGPADYRSMNDGQR